MNKLKKRKKPGFTLIEMVVVIAIVVIVAAIAIPQALKAVNKAKASTDIANARNYAGEIMNKVANGELELLSETGSDDNKTTDIKITDDMLGKAPEKSKLEKDGEFYYVYDKSKDTIKIKIKKGTSGETGAIDAEIYPTLDAPWSNYVSK